MEKYSKEKKIGEGTYGIVYRAIVHASSEVVALKKIRMGNIKDGVSFTALREIKILQEINHPNVIKNVWLVFDFMDSDLETVVKDQSIVLSPGDIKSYMQMMLQGLDALHSRWVLHRDVKPNNLLLSATDGVLRLADFGFARRFGSPNPRYTHLVVTRWYRAPELLFGARAYGPAVDIWAAACVLAEMLLRTPYLPGDSDIDQLAKIFAALGTPTEQSWPGVTALPDYMPFTAVQPTPLRALFSAAGDDTLDLLAWMLRFDPNKRPTAAEALRHPYFTNAPSATPPAQLPRCSKAGSAPSDARSPGKRPVPPSPSQSQGQPHKRRIDAMAE